MIANGASAISFTIYITLSNKRKNNSFYFSFILNWFSFIILTLTLIHIADLQQKYQEIDSDTVIYETVSEIRETGVSQNFDESIEIY